MYIYFSFFFACSNATTETIVKEEAVAEKTSAATEKKPTMDVKDIQNYGAPFTIEKSIPAADLLQNPETYVGQKVRVEGTVSDVCQKMGCWMVISEADKHMRITTKGHKFFVAKDGAGNRCQIEGEVIARELDPDRTAHFESETSDGAPMPEKQAKDNKTYEIVASSVQFLGKK
ncbi:MAG: DUF4920 domain-containing protein [Myxococcota bacterium]|nr:DUF4920 domain-containing protein [Myxococcota bacterium]